MRDVDKIEAIKEILEDVINIDAEGLSSETTFESLGLDSLDAVELIAEVEDRFDVELADPDKIATVEDLLARLG